MGFEKVFNHKPQVKESANARVNLIGEHTDYTGGYVMPTLLGFKNTIEMSKNNDQNFVVFSEYFNEKVFFNLVYILMHLLETLGNSIIWCTLS